METAQDLRAQYNQVKARALLEARAHLLPFTKYTKRDYQINWHHRIVCDLLTKFAFGEIKKLAIFQPPQTGKSELSSRRFPAFKLGIDPNTKIALCGYADTFTQKFNRSVQRIIDTPEYSEIFPSTTLNSRNVATMAQGNWVRTSNLFEIVGHSGFLYTTGVGGPLTGNSVDVGIIDDPVKDRKTAKSKAFKTAVWEWYTDVFETRLDNKSQQLILMTRWEEDDLAGRILARDGEFSEGGEWHVVRLEGIKETNDGHPEDPRGIGEALWPEKHSLDRWEKIREKNPRTFTSLYQQRPAPMDGDILKRSYFDIIEHRELPLDFFNRTVHFTIDTAYTKKAGNDPSAILGFVKYKEDLYIVYFYKARLEFNQLLKKLKQKVEQFGSDNSAVFIEPKASGLSVYQELRRTSGLNVIKHKMEAGDKEERTNSLEPYYEAGRVKLVRGTWTPAFLLQVLAFPNAKHDEEVDCMNMAVTEALARGKGGGRAMKRRTVKRIT